MRSKQDAQGQKIETREESFKCSTIIPCPPPPPPPQPPGQPPAAFAPLAPNPLAVASNLSYQRTSNVQAQPTGSQQAKRRGRSTCAGAAAAESPPLARLWGSGRRLSFVHHHIAVAVIQDVVTHCSTKGHPEIIVIWLHRLKIEHKAPAAHGTTEGPARPAAHLTPRPAGSPLPSGSDPARGCQSPSSHTHTPRRAAQSRRLQHSQRKGQWWPSSTSSSDSLLFSCKRWQQNPPGGYTQLVVSHKG